MDEAEWVDQPRKRRRTTTELSKDSYVREPHPCFNTDYSIVPKKLDTLTPRNANTWFCLYFPYLLSVFSPITFIQALLYWLTNTDEGRNVLKEAIRLLDPKYVGRYSKLSKVVQEKFDTKIQSEAIGAAWIRAGIPIKRYVSLKSYLSSDQQKFLPSTNNFKSFSGSIRKWLFEGPLKLTRDINDKWIGIKDGKAFIYYCLKIFAQEGLISKENSLVYLKIAYDKRVSVESTPTICSISLAGKHLCPENCITLIGFLHFR